MGQSELSFQPGRQAIGGTSGVEPEYDKDAPEPFSAERSGGNNTGRGIQTELLFYPLISEQEYLKSETKSFMKKLYGGALKPMLANFLQDKKLNEKEIDDLKALFDESRNNDDR